MATHEDATTQAQNLALRKDLADAYASIEGAKQVQSFAALTFEELLDQQIERIEGADRVDKPNEINRVARTLARVVGAVGRVQSLPDEAFVAPDPQYDVNT